MLRFIVEQHSEDGKFVGPGRVGLEPSEHVFPIEIRAVWESIKGGRLENQARELLLKLCKERGIDSHDIS